MLQIAVWDNGGLAEGDGAVGRAKAEAGDVVRAGADVEPAIGEEEVGLGADFPIAAEGMTIEVEEAVAGCLQV